MAGLLAPHLHCTVVVVVVVVFVVAVVVACISVGVTARTTWRYLI
jgi:hypothetical protein